MHTCAVGIGWDGGEGAGLYERGVRNEGDTDLSAVSFEYPSSHCNESGSTLCGTITHTHTHTHTHAGMCERCSNIDSHMSTLAHADMHTHTCTCICFHGYTYANIHHTDVTRTSAVATTRPHLHKLSVRVSVTCTGMRDFPHCTHACCTYVSMSRLRASNNKP